MGYNKEVLQIGRCESEPAKPSSLKQPGSAATCEWETVSPAKICGEPAAYKDTNGKHYCERHGNYLAKRYPTTMVKIEVPPNKD